jgi:cobalamin biosynthesis Mg chelatase CobN
MKLFQILMSLVIAFIAAVILCGTLSSCHSVKKSTTANKATYDSAAHVLQSSHTIDTSKFSKTASAEIIWIANSDNDYDREIITEEFSVPTTVSKEDYGGVLLTGKNADSFWRSGHLVKRTTTREKGRQITTETSTSKTKDSSGSRAGTGTADVNKRDDTVSRVVQQTGNTKAVTNTARGWWIVAIVIVILIAAMTWLYFNVPHIPLFKSNSDD